MKSAAIEKLALHLLVIETAGDLRNSSAIPALHTCDKLRAPLAKLAGIQGFNSLLSRALSLASRQVPSLVGVRVEADGSLTGLDAIDLDADKSEGARHGGTVLVAELLKLLVTFIGESLTLSLVRNAWPHDSIEIMSLISNEAKS